MIKYALIFILGLQLGLVQQSSARQPTTSSASNSAIKLADLPTFDNFSAYILAHEVGTNKPNLGAQKSQLEKNIHASLTEDPNPFLSDLSPDAVNLTLKLVNGIYVIQRVDGILTLASQEIAEDVNSGIPKTNNRKETLSAIAQEKIKRIIAIEAKRNELAGYIAKLKDDYNFNPIFEYMIQANFRKPNRMSQGLLWPPRVQNLMWGKKNPYQAAFLALKSMTFEVLTADQSNPLVQVRRLKINSTAQMVPFFKPSVHSWEVEAFYFNKKNDRIPSSEKPK